MVARVPWGVKAGPESVRYILLIETRFLCGPLKLSVAGVSSQALVPIP